MDGSGVGDVGAVVLRDRKILAEDGMVVVILNLQHGQLLCRRAAAAENYSRLTTGMTIGLRLVCLKRYPLKSEKCTVRPSAPCRQYPFERAAAGVLQVPERQKKDCKFGGFA